MYSMITIVKYFLAFMFLIDEFNNIYGNHVVCMKYKCIKNISLRKNQNDTNKIFIKPYKLQRTNEVSTTTFLQKIKALPISSR